MPVTNDPYSRPINATRAGAAQVGEHYGDLATDKRRVMAAGNPNAASAVASTAPYVADGSNAPLPVFERVELAYPTPSPEPTSPNTDTTSPSDDDALDVLDALVPPTEDDLFG